MPPDNDCVEIVVCYGTSCFARGNAENLDLLNTLEQSPACTLSVRLKGKLCQGQCAGGPNLMIDGNHYHDVTVTQLRELLRQRGSSVGDHYGNP